MKDQLGTRMKEFYENRTRYYLPRRTFTILRLDGKAFHTFTKHFEKPFSSELTDAMDYTAKCLAEQIQGVKLTYTQSDEISLLLTDFDKLTTDAWFDGNLQKMVSVAASIATASFNSFLSRNKINVPLALFDCRAFTIPYVDEVHNYFIWRQQDAIRNSISMAAQSHFSSKELHKCSTKKMLEMLSDKGIEWDKHFSSRFRRGEILLRVEHLVQNANGCYTVALRNKWENLQIDNETPLFQEQKDLIRNLLP